MEQFKGTVGCLSILALNLVIGSYASAYDAWFVFGKWPPLWLDVVTGIFLGEFTIPFAIFCFFANLAGIPHPWVK